MMVNKMYLQDDDHDDNFDLEDDGYDEKKWLFWLICHVFLLLSLINLNVYAINVCWFDLFS